MHLHTLVMDWLELSFLGLIAGVYPDQRPKEIIKFEYISLKLIGKGTQYFHHRFEVYYQQTLIGELVMCPRASILDAKLIKFKLQNNLLYEVPPYDLVELFEKELSLRFNNVTRFDLAYDFEQFKNGIEPTDLITRLITNEIKRKGRAIEFNVFSRGGVYTGCRFGKTSSDRCATLYNKTKELQKQQGNKKYITDFHRLNGLGLTDKHVWRLELRMYSEELKKWGEKKNEPIKDWRDLFDLDIQRALFRSLVASYLNFIIPEKCGKGVNQTALDFIEFPESPLYLYRLNTYPKAKYWRLKLAIKHLVEEYYRTARDEHAVQIRQWVDQFKLHEWYHKKISEWEKEYELLKNPFLDYLWLSDYVPRVAVAAYQTVFPDFQAIRTINSTENPQL